MPTIERAIVKLDATLSVTAAASLLNSINAHHGSDLRLVASDVKHLDAPCAQIILAAQIAWGKSGHRFEISAPSEGFINGVNSLGLHTLLEEFAQ